MCNLFKLMNIDNVFYNRNVCDKLVYLDKIKCLIQEECFRSLEGLPKLRTYTRFNYSFATENYIYNSMSRSQRSLIAQLRCGVPPIAIEICRYTNKAVQDRLCTL